MKAAQEALSGQRSFPWAVPLIPAIVLAIAFLLRRKIADRVSYSRNLNSFDSTYYAGQKVVPGLGSTSKSFGFSVVQLDLVQEAFVVFRHSSTRGMDRGMDFLASVAEAVAKTINGFTARVRSRQRKKGDDDDVDLLHLRQSQVKSEFGLDMGKVDDPILKDAELAKFVDEVSNEGTASKLKSEWH